MKEIGNQFKEAREEIGISEEESASDLGITVAQLENLEAGNANAFKDIFFLKEIIKKYAKYLNLNEDKIIDEFNDFIFNYTSRIPIEEIEQKVKEKAKEQKIEQEKIISPYTMKQPKKSKVKPIIIYIISGLILVLIALLVIALIKRGNDSGDIVGYNLLKGVSYECTK